ncbi:MAG: hypothetical protein V1494_01065 [Candidatus Diapherotrites archaeon]
MDKKGQSALEYLMTYGWALVVIVIVIVALVFLINPSQVGTSGCTGFEKIPIANFQLNSGGLTLRTTNETGRALSLVTATAIFDANTASEQRDLATEFDGTQAMQANAAGTMTFTAPTTLNAGSHAVDLVLSYFDGDFTRQVSGSCKGTI